MTTKLLASEDSRTIRNLLRMSLENAGFEFHTAVDGVDGVARFAEVQPDVVITDINMPNMDGYGVIETLRSGPRKTSVPILVLTTEASDDMKNQGKAAGATGWMVKPFDPAKLLAVASKVLP